MTTIDLRDVYDVDACQDRAHELNKVLKDRGITNFVHWDRSPWGVRIPLTHDSTDEHSPSLFVLTEGTESVAGFEDTWVWHGVLGGFPEEMQDALQDTDLRWIERHWLGHGVDHIADVVTTLHRVLQFGASHAAGA